MFAPLINYIPMAALAARLCSDSPALQAAAEECMAAHTPLPHELVERVLLSPDLVPAILGPLEAEDGAAAAVCSQWLVGWKATNEPRRRLKQVPLDFPEEIDTDGMHMIGTGTPDGRLVVATDSEVHILDRSMRVLQTVACENYEGSIAASDESIFHTVDGGLHRFSHDGTPAADLQAQGSASSRRRRESSDSPLRAAAGAPASSPAAAPMVLRNSTCSR